jgi:hypothetical protein
VVIGESKPAAVGATRTLGAMAMVGSLLLIAYGWLTWASFAPKWGGPTTKVNGWGDVTSQGEATDLPIGAVGMPYVPAFIPLFVIPVLVLGLLVLCNIGRLGNSIAILVLAILHLLFAIACLALPSVCILFDIESDSGLFEATHNFSTGPGAILATLTMLAIVGTSIAGIVLGRKVQLQLQAPPTYVGYPPN